MSEVEKKREELMHKTFVHALQIIFIFGIPAAIGYFVGKWVDTAYDIRPKGTMAVLAVTFIFSWALVVRMYLKLSKQFRELREEEERVREEKR